MKTTRIFTLLLLTLVAVSCTPKEKKDIWIFHLQDKTVVQSSGSLVSQEGITNLAELQGPASLLDYSVRYTYLPATELSLNRQADILLRSSIWWLESTKDREEAIAKFNAKYSLYCTIQGSPNRLLIPTSTSRFADNLRT